MKITFTSAHKNNFEVGRKGTTIDRIVLHWIVGKLSAADVTFKNGDKQVSSHYGIGGTVVHQYVKEEDTAYHAGVFSMNLRSIGIEHEGGPDIPISNETYETSAQIVSTIAKKYAIPLARSHIIGHREVKATQCPGTLDIDRIIRRAKELTNNVPSEDIVTLKSQIDTLKKQVEDEIQKKNETWQELQEVKIDLQAAQAEIITYQNFQSELSTQLKCNNQPTSIVGQIDKLLSEEQLLRQTLEKMQDSQTNEAGLQKKLDETTKMMLDTTLKNNELNKSLQEAIRGNVDLQSKLNEVKKAIKYEKLFSVGKYIICVEKR